MRKGYRLGWLAALTLAAAAQAQVAPPAPLPPAAPAVPVAPAAPSAAAPAAPAAAPVDMHKLCADLPAQPTEARAIAQRSQCVLGGFIPSDRRFAEARELARKAMDLGEPAGGFLLFLAFANDPAYAFRQDGKVDLDAYRRLAALPLERRAEQVEAIEGLGFAAGKDHVPAAALLANYYYETVAPRNVARVRAIVDLLARRNQRHPALDKIAREALAIERTAPATRASVRTFFDAYRAATAAALAGHAAQTAGGKCEQADLKAVSASDIRDARYLPLKGPMVAGTFLVKGSWNEFWTFAACGQEVPVKLAFEADGWGGATFSAAHNKGE